MEVWPRTEKKLGAGLFPRHLHWSDLPNSMHAFWNTVCCRYLAPKSCSGFSPCTAPRICITLLQFKALNSRFVLMQCYNCHWFLSAVYILVIPYGNLSCRLKTIRFLYRIFFVYKATEQNDFVGFFCICCPWIKRSYSNPGHSLVDLSRSTRNTICGDCS
jgi:hypothetical protein